MVFPTATASATVIMTLSPPTSSSSSHFTKVNAVKTNHKQLKLAVKIPSNNRLTASPRGVTDKLNGLAFEFGSLTEPIDRVKRLLHYASLLPPLENSYKVPENRVVGCTTEVWVVADMDKNRRMRFKADSDSEISKGFCWCLVWMLDGAKPEEVLTVEMEELVGMNVGLNVKTRSRVNTWQNVLVAMQKATQDLILRNRMDGCCKGIS